MKRTTWTTMTTSGRTTAMQAIEHQDDVAAIVAYHCALQGLAPLPLDLDHDAYLFSTLELDGHVYATDWHQLRHGARVPVAEDDVLDTFARHLVTDIETALL